MYTNGATTCSHEVPFYVFAKLTGLRVTYISCVCELRAFVVYLGIKFTWVAWLT